MAVSEAFETFEVVKIDGERGGKLGGEERARELLRALLRLRSKHEQRGKPRRVGVIFGELGVGLDSADRGLRGGNAVRSAGDDGGVYCGARGQIVGNAAPWRVAVPADRRV